MLFIVLLVVLAAVALYRAMEFIVDKCLELQNRRIMSRHWKKKQKFKNLFDEVTFDMDCDNRHLAVLRERCDGLVRRYTDDLEKRFKSMLDAEVRSCVAAAMKDVYNSLDTIEKKTAYEKGLRELSFDFQQARQFCEKLDVRLSELKDVENKLEHISAFYDMMEVDGFWAPFKTPARRGRPSNKDRS